MPRYRIAVLADIHGNLTAFEAVLADLKQFGALDRILAAGDIICGPGQKAVLRRLVEMDALMIQGNNEQAIARMAAGTAPDYFYHSQQFALRRWSFEHLDAEELRRVCALPEQRVFTLPGADPIRMAHGSPRDINELVLPPSQAAFLEKYLPYDAAGRPTPLDEIFGMAPEPVLLFGHTHLPWQERLDDRLAMNPGAVNFSENGFVGAQYAVLDWDGIRWTPQFRAIPYDLDALRRSNEESGFLDSGVLARIFLDELISGKDLVPDFFKLAGQLAEEAGCGDLPYFPDEIWEQAGRAFGY